MDTTRLQSLHMDTIHCDHLSNLPQQLLWPFQMVSSEAWFHISQHQTLHWPTFNVVHHLQLLAPIDNHSLLHRLNCRLQCHRFNHICFGRCTTCRHRQCNTPKFLLRGGVTVVPLTGPLPAIATRLILALLNVINYHNNRYFSFPACPPCEPPRRPLGSVFWFTPHLS